jgi:hypothetical protein
VYVIFFSWDHLGGAWMFMYPAMSITRAKNYFRPRETNIGDSRRMDPAKPLQSEHWGTPSQPFSN